MPFHNQKSRTRIIAGFGLVAISGLVLAGCSSTTASGTASKTLVVQEQAGTSAITQVDGFIKVFEAENPGVTVKKEIVSQTAKTGSNMQVIASSGAPDVAVVPTNTEAYTKLVTGKQIEPLSDVWSADKLQSRYGDSLANSLKVNNVPYVVSYDSEMTSIIYYNEALFKQLGIADPTDHRFSSLSDLEGVVAKLHAAGKQGIAIGPTDNYQTSWMVDQFLPTTANSSEFKNYLTSWQGGSTKVTAKYTDAPFVDAISRIQELGKAGVFQNGYLGQNVAQAEASFVQGQSGMLIDGDWSVQTLQGDKIPFDFGWALLPPVGTQNKSQLSLYNGDAFAIPVKAQNPTLAKKFLETVMSVKGQQSLIKNGALPAVNDVPSSAYTGLSTQVSQMLADIKTNGAQPGWTGTVPGGLGQQLVDPLLQQMLNGQGTPETIAATVQKELLTTRSAE
jgi:raffinose/stachyose/melibiose transport system substrate-binding protein